jgi:hypothetical protein
MRYGPTHVVAIVAFMVLSGCVAEKGPTNVYIIDQSAKPDPKARQLIEERTETTTIIQRPVSGQTLEIYNKGSSCNNPSSDMAIYEKRMRTDLKTIGKSESEINNYIQNWKRENNYLC